VADPDAILLRTRLQLLKVTETWQSAGRSAVALAVVLGESDPAARRSGGGMRGKFYERIETKPAAAERGNSLALELRSVAIPAKLHQKSLIRLILRPGAPPDTSLSKSRASAWGV
jgi:hypothetical protein